MVANITKDTKSEKHMLEEELADTLTAISVIAKRLAAKIRESADEIETEE